MAVFSPQNINSGGKLAIYANKANAGGITEDVLCVKKALISYPCWLHVQKILKVSTETKLNAKHQLNDEMVEQAFVPISRRRRFKALTTICSGREMLMSMPILSDDTAASCLTEECAKSPDEHNSPDGGQHGSAWMAMK